MRNGAGRFEVGNRKFTNAMDSYGKLASWKFPGNGSAYFSTKMIYSNSYKEAIKNNDISPYLMLDRVDPPFDFISELESFKNGPDNMNVNIFNFGDEKNHGFVVVSDYWNVYQIDPYTLDTIGGFTPPIDGVNPLQKAIVLGTAHPLPEYGTDHLLTFVTVASPFPQIKSKHILTRTTSAGNRTQIATVDVDKAAYMHSFAVTPNYAVIMAVPFYINPLGMLKNFEPLDAFEWLPNAVTQLHVVNLKSGEVKTLETENMFFLHVVNAYESSLFKNEIVIDVCTYKDIDEMRQMNMTQLHNATHRAKSSPATLKRYTLDLDKNDVNVYTYEQTSGIPFINELDFPTINENYRSKKYCYAYGIVDNFDGKDFLNMAIVKKDVCTGKNEKAWFAPGMYLNEAWFQPNPNGTEEDDGILILPVFDLATQTTNITMFDAKDLSIINTAKLPVNIPFGTHGRFFDYIY